MGMFKRAKIALSASTPHAGRPRRRADRGFRPEACMLEERRVLSTFTVTNTSGSTTVEGSLPWAVQQANYFSPGLDYIHFAIPGPGPHVIHVTDTLYLNEQTVVDGRSQPGYAGSPQVVIQGDGKPPSLFLLHLQSSGSTIRGLAMVGYTANAVTIFNDSQGNWILDNYMGFAYDAAGRVTLNKAYAAESAGIGIQSSYNTVRWNTISGVYNGVNMGGDGFKPWDGTEYRQNAIMENRIGTDPTGSTANGFGNDSDGIFLWSGARANFLGPGNTISGNKSAGVELLHSTNNNNVIFSNMIGLDRTGMNAIPNGELGVLISGGASGNAVGGPFGGNVISANVLGGINLGTALWGGAHGNWVQNNIVGLNVVQSAVVGSQNVGIGVEAGSTYNSISDNVVAGNVANGFVLSEATSNYVGSNDIGRASWGYWFPNRYFGVALMNKSNWNWIWSNRFGSNGQGSYYVDPNSSGNSIVA